MTTLLENPIPVLFVGVTAVAILGIVFFQTGRTVFLLAIAGVVLLTLLGLGVEYFVVTDREAVEMVLYAMADAMEGNDKDAAIALLAPSAAETRSRAEWAFARFEVQKANISRLEIEVNTLTSPPSATARFHGFIQVRDRRGEVPYNASNFYFVIDYRKLNGRWLITGHQEKISGFGSAPK